MATAQVNDGEPPMSQPNLATPKNTRIVRATVLKCVAHAPEPYFIHALFCLCWHSDAADSTHAFTALRVRRIGTSMVLILSLPTVSITYRLYWLASVATFFAFLECRALSPLGARGALFIKRFDLFACEPSD
jgi:hypothetical protein